MALFHLQVPVYKNESVHVTRECLASKISRTWLTSFIILCREGFFIILVEPLAESEVAFYCQVAKQCVESKIFLKKFSCKCLGPLEIYKSYAMFCLHIGLSK